jgi:hypothetical protein
MFYESHNLNSTQTVLRAPMSDTVLGSAPFADHVISLQYRRVTGIDMRAQ